MRSEGSSNADGELDKPLGLFDVYAISTGAMFASGFFLLPGVAAAQAGPAVIGAYGIASLLMIPTTLAIAELSTTLPRAGGPYYFIDRSFGPAMGTVGGLGVWLVLILKSAFALVGMGAYLGLVLEFPIEPIAIATALAFAVLNIFGAKQGARLQQILVVALLVLMLGYVLNGLWAIGREGFSANAQRQLTPWLPFGVTSLPATIGMVFVSFAGLTKVASVAEEIDQPERNLPLGMGAALVSVSIIYVLGIYVMVATLPSEVLHEDLTPVATAGSEFIAWLPSGLVTVLIVVAAVSAFASTGNAGLLAASRIPMAMARDGLAWSSLDKLGRFGTPTRGILLTAAVMVAMILLLDVESLARLASSFLLFVFALLNLTVIVMRESKIESYVPEFRTPLYPAMPIIGMVASLALIFVLGWFYVLFLATVIAVSLLWYWWYASRRVERRGAIYNVFARLAKRKHEPLEEELWNIMQEHTTSEEELYDEVVARAIVIDFSDSIGFEELLTRVSKRVAEGTAMDAELLREQWHESGAQGGPPIAGEAVLIDLCKPFVDQARLALVRVRRGAEREAVEQVVGETVQPTATSSKPVVHAALFWISPESDINQHQRISAALSARIDEPGFLSLWQNAKSDQDLREVFLRSDRFILLRLMDGASTGKWIGQRIDALPLPNNVRVVAMHRNGDTFPPDPDTVLGEHDRITVAGDPQGIEQVYEEFGTPLDRSPQQGEDRRPQSD